MNYRVCKYYVTIIYKRININNTLFIEQIHKDYSKYIRLHIKPLKFVLRYREAHFFN